MKYACISRRHAQPDAASAERCCAGQQLEDKSELLKRREAPEQTINALQRQVTDVQAEIESLENTKRKLESDLAQAKVTRYEMLARGEIPEPANDVASLPSDIDSIKQIIQKKNDELQNLLKEHSAAAARLDEIDRQLERIYLHARRDNLYEKMLSLIFQWNECAAELQQIRQVAGDTRSDFVDGEYAILPPDMVRWGGDGRAVVKGVGLRADVEPFRTGARNGMFL